MHKTEKIGLALLLSLAIAYALAGFPTEGQALDVAQSFETLTK